MEGIDPVPFQEPDYVKLGWFQQIYRFVQRRSKMVNITSADSPYGVPSDTYWVRADATSGAITINLPPALNWRGRHIGAIKTDASGNAVTFDGAGSDLINGSGTLVLSAQYDTETVQADGLSNWDVN